MRQTIDQHRYTQAIINAIAEINPHYNTDGRIGYVYAAGFLASYLASLMERDPYVYKEFIRHLGKVKAQNKSQNKNNKP